MAVPEPAGKPCTIVLHDDRNSSVDILAGSRALHIGEFAWLTAPGARRLCISPAGLASNTGEISIHASLAKRFGFENRTHGHVQLIEDTDAATATHVELFFRDSFLSRADMWQLMGLVQDTVIYRGQSLSYLGSETAEVKHVYISGREVESAVSIHPHTKPIFRSGSSRFTILVEISKEMLENWSNGELMYERLIHGFLPELFRRWDSLKVRHQVSVVLFGRTKEASRETKRNSETDPHNEDFFHILVSEMASTSWPQIIHKLNRAFNDPRIPRCVSLASESNLLEAIHLTAMDFADDQTDAHLFSTGTSIIAVTAGAGLFDADHKLLKETTELLIGNSIGVDILALSPKPMHPVPLFRYTHNGTTEYALPHWVDISFWESSHDVYTASWTLPSAEEPVNEISFPLMRESGWGEVDAAVMDSHDNQVFHDETAPIDQLQHVSSNDTKPSVFGSVETMRGIPIPSRTQKERVESTSIAPIESLPAGVDSTPQSNSSERPKTPRPSRHPLLQTGRKISLGPKGLAPTRGMASTTVSATNAEQLRELPPPSSPSPKDNPSGLARAIRASLARQPSQQSLVSHRTNDADESSMSKPINIHTGHEPSSVAVLDPASDVEQQIAGTTVGTVLQNNTSLSATPKAGYHFSRKGSLNDTLDMLSPWVMLLNPCNPRRDNMKVASQYRKWQHVFPRAISSGSFKWSSMCAPATLPLTAEYKPSASELSTHYNKKVRRHIISNFSLRDEAARVLVERLVDVRLIRGFQIVAIRNSGSEQTYQSKNKPILMSLGRRYHEVQRLSDFEVQIVQYDPIAGIGSEVEEPQHYLTPYEPNMRMTTGVTIKPEVTYHTESTIADWTSLDEHILGLAPMPDYKVTFKVRLVLIPVDMSAHTRLGELSDQERRIEGIQRLTQTWQRQRHFTAEDQEHHVSLTKTKPTATTSERDPNPLAIEYQTKDPSVVVNAHGPTLSTQLEDGEVSTPLFAESEKHHTSNFDVAKLVKQMQDQPPYGVEMRDRRWLTLTHLKCFRGDEMTTWLLGIFKDLDLREDAVAIGNELMSRGIFNHVRNKHNFRDGHYFYQVAHAHRVTDYPDTQSFLNKLPWRSVPATPLADLVKSPGLRPVSGDSSSSSGRGTPMTGPVDAKEILLSQMMLYNVDPQKHSDHLQVVDLHYDRIHNPENCYHIQLEWLGASTKLIKDALSRWSGVVEGYGLKLAQVPLEEASRFREHHPFDQPQIIKLALNPPDKILTTPIIEPHSASPRHVEDRFAYHKAVLRKMDFVLDYEAASAFTSNLHVSYSWGPPTFAYTQFVHKTGLVLVQIIGDGSSDFLVLPNRLATSRPYGSTKQSHEAETAESIVKNLHSFCRDGEGLRQFYSQADKPRVPANSSPFSSNASLTSDFDVPPMNLPPHLLNRSVGHRHGG